MKLDPSLELLKNKETADYAIINLAPDKAFKEKFGADIYKGWGSVVHIASAEMAEKGLDIVLFNLQGFFQRDSSGKSEYALWSRLRQRKFEHQHLYLGIGLSNDKLILQPLRMGPEGGHSGEPQDRLEIPLPTDQKTFCEELAKAYAKCR